MRFTQSKDGRQLYAIALGLPTRPLHLTTLAGEPRPITDVRLLGSQETITWALLKNGLIIQPVQTWPSANAVAFRITFAH